MPLKYLPLAPEDYSESSGFETEDRPDHHGVDFAADLGTPIYSVSDGFMAHVGINDDPDGYGSWLVVDSQQQWDLDFTYGHMHPSTMINPRTGQTWRVDDEVKAGDIIAKVGNEGGSSGPHLHFETSGPPGRFGGDYLDPGHWLFGATDPRKAKETVTPQPEVPPVSIIPTVKPGDLLIDYSAAVPSARAVRDAGYRGAVRYISPARESWMGGKPLKRAEADDYKANGLVIVSNWQFAKGGNETSDWIRGAEGGRADAQRAVTGHRDAGGPDAAPIYFSVDAAPTDWMIVNQVLPYLKAAQEVVGKDRMGVYCNPTVLDRCLEAGVGSWFWEHGWGGNKDAPAHPRANIKQFEIDKLKVDGVGIDRNRVITDRIGAWGEFEGATYNPPPTPEPPKVREPNGYQIIDAWKMGINVGYSEGHAERLRDYIHTTENQDWITDALDVARYQARQQDGSYHFLIDDNKIVATVPFGHSAWGVLSDNSRSLQIALVMTSGTIEQWSGANPNREGAPKTREQWLKHDKMLDMLGWVLAITNRTDGVPMKRVDAAGVGRNERGVSSHNSYTYGSVQLLGYKDGTHWDVPLSTFPIDVVLNIANGYLGLPSTPPPPPVPVDPLAYPLAWADNFKQYWGPLEGPAESISNRNGDETQASKDGLKRWQEALGIPASGIYDDSTRLAATRMQQLNGWPVTGFVWKGEWELVIKNGWRLPVNPITRPSSAHINPGTKVTKTVKVKDLTGPGHSDKWMIGGTDLGVMCLNSYGHIVAAFGDTFDGKVGTPGWRSPTGLLSKTTNLDDGIVWEYALGGDHNYGRQLWDYTHDVTPDWSNGGISTVIPSDLICIGNKLYLHAIVNRGFGNVTWTEIQESDDGGETWHHSGAKFPADLCQGNAQLWTWDLGPDGYVYVMSTGFQRNDPLILRRVKAERITDPAAYENWGWDANHKWSWGNATATPILANVTSGERFGEMCLRYIQGQWVLVNFDASTQGGYDIDVRVFANPTDNMYEAKKSTPIRGVGWGQEGPDAVAQLYGPSIVPGSTFDAGFHIAVSQWNTAEGWPYRAMQFKIPVDPVIAVPAIEPPLVDPPPVVVPEPKPEVPVVVPPVVTPIKPVPVTTNTKGSFLKDIAALFSRLFLLFGKK